MKIGDYIKKNRKLKNMTIIDLANASGVSKSYISRIERNESNPWPQISALLNAFNLTVDDANKAGVQWWATDPEPKSKDLDIIIEWLKKQDDKTLRFLARAISVDDYEEE